MLCLVLMERSSLSKVEGVWWLLLILFELFQFSIYKIDMQMQVSLMLANWYLATGDMLWPKELQVDDSK